MITKMDNIKVHCNVIIIHSVFVLSGFTIY